MKREIFSVKVINKPEIVGDRERIHGRSACRRRLIDGMKGIQRQNLWLQAILYRDLADLINKSIAIRLIAIWSSKFRQLIFQSLERNRQS